MSENKSKNSSSNKVESFKVLIKYIEKEGIDPDIFLHDSEKNINYYKNGKGNPNLFLRRKIMKSFNNVDWKKVNNNEILLSLNDDLGFEQKTKKIRYLNSYLVKKGLTVARVLGISDRKYKELQSGYDIPNNHLLKKLAIYFSLPVNMFIDDSISLPKEEELKIDEDLASIQRNDLSEIINYNRNKYFLRRNYNILSHKMRIKMFVSLFAVIIPLGGFTAYSSYLIISNRNESIAKTKDNNIDSDSQKFIDTYLHQNNKETNDKLTYCDVSIGAQVNKIYDIQPSNEYFSVAMNVWMDFSQDEFHTMFKNYKNPNWEDEIGDKEMDVFTVNSESNIVTYASDGILDYIELAKPYSLLKDIELKHPGWISDNRVALIDSFINDSEYNVVPALFKEERLSYPLLHESNVYDKYPRNFDIGKGVNNDSLAYYYAPGEPYYLTKEDGSKEFRFFQNCVFTAKVAKAYDNPRYPLETAQFWINIEPTSWLHVSNLRYVAKDIIDVSKDQSTNNTHKSCSIDKGIYTTMGKETQFTDGLRFVNNSEIKNHNEMVEYEVNEDNKAYSYSKYTIVVRANRAAFTTSNFLPSTFLQSFINLFAVIIWIIIAFYNQSYANEDSLWMLGTGMFSTISATIVGLQALSDASMFSLLTMINIFTLAVILIMTYEAIIAKRANAKGDKILIAYNGVKLRILFYVLTICTLVIFVGLPIASYIWTL